MLLSNTHLTKLEQLSLWPMYQVNADISAHLVFCIHLLIHHSIKYLLSPDYV